MYKNIFINLILSAIIFMIGLMFIEGIWQKKGKIIKNIINIDYIIFPNATDKRIFILGNQLAFIICALMALLTLINCLLLITFDYIPNMGGIFFFLSAVFTWPIRVIFILFYKRYPYEKAPRIWPFKK